MLNKKARAVLLGLFADDLENLLVVLPVSTVLLSEAAAVARKYSLRASDALHLATALRAKQASATDIVFVASDKELIDAAADAAFPALDPESKDALATLLELRQ